ncbi:MAG: ABC transporter ATP-binding protein [Nitrospinota bacterium]|nr:ABC transporter ATP-binding protein [Nitrospinota bacterium]
MTNIAIKIDGVDKRFRRVKVGGGGYTTLKSALVGALKSMGGSSREKTFEALRDVSFDIPAGQTWGIIGRNGSGKSTLLKLMAGIYKVDAGAMTMQGRVSALIELGAGFHPDFSGRENIFINASILGMGKKEIQEKFDQIVAFAELEEFIDDPVRTYSSGMFMRLGFSVAIHSEPDILLVDEVLAVGDSGFTFKCKDKITGFRKAGKTIVLVTHDLADVSELCDQAVWLEAGRVKLIDQPKRVIDEYLTSMAKLENKAMLENGAKEDLNDSATASRWGSKEAFITSVSIKDGSGEERRVFRPEDAMALRLEYTAAIPLADPVFGIAIYKKDGTLCYGTNTHIEGIDLPSIEGEGSVSIDIDRIGLVDGSYTFSVAVHAKDGHPYDYHDQMYEFHVRSGIDDVGVYRLSSKWAINGAPEEGNRREGN